MKLFNEVCQKRSKLRENDPTGAFSLMNESIQLYNRFSYIRCDIRESCGREGAAVKERLSDMCKYLLEVHTDCRIAWKLAVEGIRNNREDM